MMLSFENMKSTTIARFAKNLTPHNWLMLELVFDPGMWLLGMSAKTHQSHTSTVYKASINPLPCFKLTAELVRS